MSRTNTGSTSNYLRQSVAEVTVAPLTLAAKFRPQDFSQNNNLVNISLGDSRYYALAFDGNNAYGLGSRVALLDVNSDTSSGGGVPGNGIAASPAHPNRAGEWLACVGVQRSDTNRQAYLNGVPGAVDTTPARPSPLLPSYITVGLYLRGSDDRPFSPMNGAIADVAIWNVDLTPQEIRDYSNGKDPRLIRRGNLVRYWPFRDGRLTDEVAQHALTQTGTVAHSTLQPRIWVPVSRRARLEVAAGAAVDLVVADASHAHAADNLALTSSTALATANAAHAHAADNLALTSATALVAADVLHAHSADGIVLSTAVDLAVADALHAHAADNVVLLVPGGENWPHPATVLAGVAYGPTGTEYVGTMQLLTAAQVWAHIIEGGLSAEQMQRVQFAAITGKSDGVGTDTETYFGRDGVTPRLVVTFDSLGNRETVAVNGS